MFLISSIHKDLRMVELAMLASLVRTYTPTWLPITQDLKFIHQKSFLVPEEFPKQSRVTAQKAIILKRKWSTIMYSESNQNQYDHNTDSKDPSAAK